MSAFDPKRTWRFPRPFDVIPQLSISRQKAGGLAMYTLIIVIAILSPATGTVTPVGVTSQIVGKFKNVDQCKAAANEPLSSGALSDLTLSKGVYWFCAYAGAK
jgi:hypothetical protein